MLLIWCSNDVKQALAVFLTVFKHLLKVVERLWTAFCSAFQTRYKALKHFLKLLNDGSQAVNTHIIAFYHTANKL